MANHQKKCVCILPLLGDPNVGCHRAHSQCVTEHDCDEGQICYAFTCVPVCQTYVIIPIFNF